MRNIQKQKNEKKEKKRQSMLANLHKESNMTVKSKRSK